jgi:SNF2 family DNA or RNA helicase
MGKKRERCLEVILNLKSTFRWNLSGTPKHGNFDDIFSLATLLGVHLGVPESLPGEKAKAYLAKKEMTGLENLSHYLEVKSLSWHLRRHMLAQQFLDRFVRQNIAEIDEIPYKEHECVVALSQVEKAIYLELETYLKSLEMNTKSVQKGNRKSTGDRETRMSKILAGSSSADEALLKASSQFNVSKSCTALETIEDVISLRKLEKCHLEEEMKEMVAAAYFQRRRILSIQKDWHAVQENGKGELIDALDVYLKTVKEKKSVPHGADDEVDACIEKIVCNALAYVTEHPSDKKYYALLGLDEEEPNKTAKKNATEIELSNLDMKVALRNHMHRVRSYAKELCGRIRSLRFILSIRQLLQDCTQLQCSACKRGNMEGRDVAILGSCGHAGCLDCLRQRAGEGHCIYPDCKAHANIQHVVSLDKLGSDKGEGTTKQFGSKLGSVVEKVEEILASGDRMIVFCQFDDLKDKVVEALRASGIKCVEVKGTVTTQINAIKVFQSETPKKSDPRVLLLKMDDEQSAGLNLTNLNHAIFIHPLLADSKAEYMAYETQAIGRIRRYGQKKTVNVWRFFASDTIDTEIYAERTGRRVD